jgi:hypothetical protein
MDHPSPSAAPRTQLVLILVIAATSLGGAYLLFLLARDDGLWGTTNRGAFVEPPVTVAELNLRTGSGQTFETAGTWWLWVVPQGPCDEPCRSALHQLGKLHVLLNRDAARVRRALVTPTAGGDAAQSSRDRQLERLSGNLPALVRGVYIVDPIGNLVFHYSLEDAGEPVLDDLKRLLKVSQIG